MLKKGLGLDAGQKEKRLQIVEDLKNNPFPLGSEQGKSPLELIKEDRKR